MMSLTTMGINPPSLFPNLRLVLRESVWRKLDPGGVWDTVILCGVGT